MSPTSPGEWAALAALAFAFALSVACNVPWRGRNRIRSLDPFGWIPFYNFFAPEPGIHDFHLLYRDRLPDGGMTTWSDLRLTRPRRWFHCLWNPGRRAKKAVHDAVVEILSASKAELDVRWSASYLLILTYVSGLPRVYTAAGTQFLIMCSVPAAVAAPPREFMRSEVHPL